MSRSHGRRRRAGRLRCALLSLSVGPLVAGLGAPAAVAQERDEPPLVPVRDFWGGAESFGADLWYVLSGVSRMESQGAWIGAGTLAVGGALLAADENIRDRLAESPGGVRSTTRDVGDFFEPAALQSNTNLYLAGLTGLAYFTRQDWLHAPAKQLLYSQWISGLIRQASGFAVGRRRPSQEETAYVFDPGNGKSFPSGHSAVAMAIATVLSHHIGHSAATLGLYGAAGTVLFQRLDAAEHWASDVWLGGALGLMVARGVIEAEESRRLTVVPGPGPAGGVGVTLSWSH